ncbi:MAG: glycosyltransferase family 4 protein [Patescibacteria group bacterium]|jgi:glycosyltransferase involved in cell wall biosynthesis
MNTKVSNGVKKILYFITQSEFGGAQRYVFDLANNLKSDFKVAIAMGEQEKDLKLAKILTENNIEYFIIPNLKRSISPINDLSALFEIIKLIKNYQPDIIHLNSSKISILGSIASLFTKTKTVYTVHGWVFNEPLPAWLKYFYLYAEKLTARFKNKIICVSEFDKQAALKYKIAPENKSPQPIHRCGDKLITIHNGLASINFYSKEEAKELLENFILENNSPARHPGLDPGSSVQRHEQVSGLRVKPAMTNNLLIGSIGNLYKTKGFEYFIEAANILTNEKKISATFIIIGEGSERKNLENLIKKYNLENNFILAGEIDEAAKLLKAFDIYICSSVKEGLPYSILEAMQAELPIITTNVGGIPEMIENNKTGLLTKPAETLDIANALEKLINNKNSATELGKNAEQTASLNFNLEKMVRETKKVYLE